MKKVILLLLYLSSYHLFSQNIPHNSSYVAVDTNCLWDEDVALTTTIGWTAYQTNEDTYTGTIDSTICVSLKAIETYGGISFAGIDFDTSRSLFIKADLNELNKIPLGTDAAYQVYEGFFDGLDGLNTSVDCPDLVCSAIILGIQIPDSTFTSTTTRWQFINASAFESGFCFPTEKFELRSFNISPPL